MMGCGWGVDGVGASANPQESPWKRHPTDDGNLLLIWPFRAEPGKVVEALDRPVTPEVAGSSPVAPV